MRLAAIFVLLCSTMFAADISITSATATGDAPTVVTARWDASTATTRYAVIDVTDASPRDWGSAPEIVAATATGTDSHFSGSLSFAPQADRRYVLKVCEPGGGCVRSRPLR